MKNDEQLGMLGSVGHFQLPIENNSVNFYFSKNKTNPAMRNQIFLIMILISGNIEAQNMTNTEGSSLKKF